MPNANKIQPKAGVFLNIPFSEYLRIDATNNSYLAELAITPAHAKLQKKETAAMNFGRASHTFLLEGEEVFDDLVIEADAGTIAAKAYLKTVEAYPGKIIVLRDEIVLIKNLGENIMRHPTARDLLDQSHGHREVTVVWQDKDTKLWCKCRLDFMIPKRGVLGDLKFLRGGGADYRKFQYELKDRYAFQSSFYLEGCNRACNTKFDKFVFIVVEKEEPYRVEVYDMDPDWFEIMGREARERLHTEKTCRENNVWPNYQDAGAGVVYVPAFMAKQEGVS